MPLTNGSGPCYLRHWPYYFRWMIEGSGSGSGPLSNGSRSGSRMPQNVRIRIRNTEFLGYKVKAV
jgi:hypothetical protein